MVRDEASRLLTMRSSDLPRRAQDNDQHLGDRTIKRLRNILAELDLRQRLGQWRVLLHRNAVLAREREDRLAGFAASFRDDARHWHGGFVVLQRNRERRRHVARSMKRPGAACFAAFGGAPTRNRTSAGSSSAARSASLSIAALSFSRAAVACRSAHSVTLVRAPASATSACTGPIGSTSSEKRERQVASWRSDLAAWPSRLTSNCAIAVPCGLANGTSKVQRWAAGSMRWTFE